MPSTKQKPGHAKATRILVWSLAIVCSGVAVDRAGATDREASTWQELSVDLARSDSADGGWPIGDGDGANPQFPLPIDSLRGRWVRFPATVDSASRGLGLRINASSALQRTASLPATCDGRPLMSRCTTSFWMPTDSDRASAVAWTDREAGRFFTPRVEVASFPESGRAIGHRADTFLSAVRALYYRTEDVDWTDVVRSIAAMPAPPDDLHPLPRSAQVLRSRLPGNRHVVIAPTSRATAAASTGDMPTCDAIGEGVGIVTLPGLARTSGDAPAAYARALHDCLMRGADRRAWIVDLRGDAGGNMVPMIGGLAPLMPVGRLHAFTDGHRIAKAQVGLDRGGVTIDRKPAFPARDAGARLQPPVIVVFGPHCSSACEQTANALAARPRTLFIGEPTVGYLTANTPLVIDDAYVMGLTSGYTQDRCGHVIEDHLTPDVAVARVDARPIAELLALPPVNDWLTGQLGRTTEPATTRCDPAPTASR